MPAPAPIARIALCNLDSLGSRAAVADLMAALPGRIGLVVASRRYGGKYGGFWRQTWRNLRRSGFAFLGYLSLQYFWYRALAALGRGLGWPCQTLRQLARRHRVDYLETAEPNAPEIVARVEAFAPDLIVALHFDHVIRRRLAAVPRLGVINIHTSLLPEFRGPFPVFWALRHGAERVGVSVHYIDSEELDTGPVLRQCPIAPAPGESVLALEARLLREGARLAAAVVAALETGAAPALPQAAGAGSYHSFPAPGDVAALRARGTRLYAWRDVIRLLRGGGAESRH